MPKKLKQVDHDSSDSAMRASAQQIWQASLGAFARAQEEGAGQLPAARAATALDLPPSDDAVSLSGVAGRDRLEQVFEQRVARALASLGVPGAAEVAALHQRVELLSTQLAALSAVATPLGRKAAGKRGEKRRLKASGGKKRAARKRSA